MKHFTLSILFLLATSVVLKGYPTIMANYNIDEFPTRLFELVDNYSYSNDSISHCEDESEKTSTLAPPAIISSFPVCPHYCEDMMHPNIGDIVYTTDCPLGAIVTLEGPVLSGMANCTGTTYTYTYVVTDACGEVATLERVYVIGNAGPTITCPPFNLILSCGDPNNDIYINTHLGLVSAYTSCQLGLTITNDYSPFPAQNCLNTKVVVFTATDACGRTSTCSTTITIIDNTAPVITQIPPSVCDVIECGADANYWFNHWINYMLSGLEATDDCDDDVDFTTVPANPTLNTVCDANGKAKTMVTFAATDFCGNSSTVTGSFIIQNNYPASFSNVPPSKTISCEEDVVFGPDPNLNDVCQTTLAHSDDADLSNLCTTIHVRTWVATDACGGLTRSTAQTITVVDDVPPVFSNIPADAFISCKNNAVFGTPNATDECTTVTVQVTNSSTGNNCNGSVTRIWIATDQCGNSASISQTISYNDVTPPVFTSVSSNATVACFDDVFLGTATATDECGSTTLASIDSSTGNNCSGTVTRTWTATDACGNVSTASQVITYNDNIPPTFSNVPSGGTVPCPSAVSFGTPTVSDNCTTATLSFTDNTTGTSCNGTVIRTWTATDDCGNTATVSRTISYSDTEVPTFSNVPSGGTAPCPSALSFGTPTVSDNCSTATLSFTDNTTGTSCNGTVTRIWTATDACGNTATVSRTISYSDTEVPTFSNVPSGGTAPCPSAVSFGTPTVSDNCSTATLGFTDNMTGTSCSGAVTRTWTATDDCGNTATVSRTIFYSDTQVPTFSNVPDNGFASCPSAVNFGTPTVTDNCSTATLGFTDNMTGTSCSGAVTRTWTATDDCGNTATVSRTIFYSDTQVPTFSNVPNNGSTSCPSAVNFGTPTVTDNCTNATLGFTDNMTGTSCSGAVTRTWTATDACGNTATVSRTIFFSDTQPPTFSNVPNNGSTSCPSAVSFATPMVADNCTSATLGFTDSTTGNSCSGTVTRTWTATDACGNTATVSRTITYNDTQVPTLSNVPNNGFVPCLSDVSFGTPTISDNCENATLDFADNATGNSCNGTVTRTWTATDACGNTTTASRTISYNDTQVPTFSNVPDNGSASCLSDVSFGTPTVVDDCTNAELDFEDSNAGDDCSGVITRTWTVTDDCGNVATVSRTISYSDTEVPTFSNVPVYGTASCLSDVNFGTPTVVDDCTNAALDFEDSNTGIVCSGTVTRTWIATDDCGNTATVSRTIVYEDTGVPTFSNVPDDGTASCLSDVSFGTPTVADDCTNAQITFVNSNTGNTCSGTVTRIWTATDDCGNMATVSRTIVYEDAEAPTFSNVPDNSSVSCLSDVNFGTPTVADDCTNAQITFVNSNTGNTCSGTVTRIWTATDDCGNMAIVSRTITYNDTAAPIFSNVPDNGSVSCLSDVSFGTPTAADDCTNAQISFANSSTGNACSGTVTRTWAATDDCGNTATVSRTISYSDTAAPTFSNVPNGGAVACLSNVSFGTPTVEDDCTNAQLNFEDSSTGNDCIGTVIRTWTATDDCGNTATVSRTISFSDTQVPAIVGCSNNVILLTITQAPVPPLFVPVCTKATTITFSATDNCTAGVNLSFDYTLDLFGNGTIDDSGFGKPNGFGFSFNYPINAIGNNMNNMFNDHILTYIATDECGNTSTCTRRIRVRDIVPPTQFCSPITLILDPITQSVSVTPMDVSGEIYECQLQSALFQTPGGSSNSLTFNCDDYNAALLNGLAIISVTIQFLDVWGNQSTCTNSVILELPFDMPELCGLVPPPGVADLQGQLLTEEQESVENVKVNLGGSVIAQMTTVADGQYHFTSLPYNNNYTVTPTLDANPLNGVSSYDLVLIQKHVVGNGSLDSPYHQIAADVNKSGGISTLDVLELRRMILHIDEAFGNNNSWRFVPADFVFATPENPFASIFPEQVFINGLTENEAHDFVGIKVGDVNSSAVANTLLGSDDRDFAGKLILNVKDKSLREGQTYQVAFTAENFKEMQGYQFSLFFDKEYLAVIDLVPGKLSGISLSNFGLSLLTDGFITTSWTDVEPVSIDKEEPLFYLTFEARQNVDLSEVLHISSQYTVAEAYDKESRLWDIGLRFDDSELVQEEFWLYQNMPNPFYHETLIGFELPQAAFVTFEVVDASGLELKRIEQHFPKGYNSIIIEHEGLSSGLLYYRITTPGFTETRKMVLQR